MNESSVVLDLRGRIEKNRVNFISLWGKVAKRKKNDAFGSDEPRNKKSKPVDLRGDVKEEVAQEKQSIDDDIKIKSEIKIEEVVSRIGPVQQKYLDVEIALNNSLTELQAKLDKGEYGLEDIKLKKSLLKRKAAVQSKLRKLKRDAKAQAK